MWPEDVGASSVDAQPYLSVILPVFNEAGALPGLFEELVPVLRGLGVSYEVLAVDDGSQDESVTVLRRLQREEPSLIIVRLRRNFGQTAAFSAGFDLARGQVIVTLDADGQNDPADIPRLLARIEEGYDIASGWRIHRKDRFFIRRLPSILANRLIAQVTDVRLHDYGCSLKAYRAEVVKSIHLYGELHRFIPALASWMGVRIAEVPVNHRPREHGRSKYGLSRTLKVLLDLATVSFLLNYAARPMQLFGGLGLLAFLAGLGIAAYLSILKLVFHESIGNRPLLLLGILLVVVGVQLITMGLLGELIIRTYHESQGKPIYAIRAIETAESNPPAGFPEKEGVRGEVKLPSPLYPSRTRGEGGRAGAGGGGLA
ncbi:MAG: glycosyltransferase [Chloroflexota bacterium]